MQHGNGESRQVGVLCRNTERLAQLAGLSPKNVRNGAEVNPLQGAI